MERERGKNILHNATEMRMIPHCSIIESMALITICLLLFLFH